MLACFDLLSIEFVLNSLSHRIWVTVHIDICRCSTLIRSFFASVFWRLREVYLLLPSTLNWLEVSIRDVFFFWKCLLFAFWNTLYIVYSILYDAIYFLWSCNVFWCTYSNERWFRYNTRCSIVLIFMSVIGIGNPYRYNKQIARS